MTFEHGNVRGVYAAHLPCSDSYGAPVARVHNGVALDMLDHAPGKREVLPFLRRWLPFGYRRVVCTFHGTVFPGDVSFLGQKSTEHRARVQSLVHTGSRFLAHEASVLFPHQELQYSLFEIRSDDDFGKNGVDGLRGPEIQRLVDNHNTPEGRLPIRGEGAVVGHFQRIACGDTTWIGVLKDGYGGILVGELVDQGKSGAQIKEVVIG